MMTPSSPSRVAAAMALLASLLVAGCAADAGSGVTIRALSTHAEHVSGDDVLLEIAADAGGSALEVQVDGSDVTSVFQEDASRPGRWTGLLSGLPVGTSEVVARMGTGAASLTLTNYPVTGPIVSGPHQTPFICQTATFALPDGTVLGPPLDEDCSAPEKVTYLYLAHGDSALTPLPDPAALPADVAEVTTLTGATVPFVVRVETGTVNRGIYQSVVLHDPTREPLPTPFLPPRGWNRRLIAVEGFGCPGGWYIQGGAQGNLARSGGSFTLLNVDRLREGYALFANTLHHAANNCNAVLASEAAMMSKERFVETYGVPDFTVSAGCSGGSYGSAQPADRVSGLFDGVLITCTFPDPLSIALSGSDGHLLSHYWNVTDPHGFTDEQKVAVTGYKGMRAFMDAANQAGRTDPVPGRVDVERYASAAWNSVVPEALRYDPKKNPTGARPTVYDAAVNIYGADPTTGFALRPFDNVGVQYGLDALSSGVISVDLFLDLNEGIGGYDQDANYVPQRSEGNPGAIERAYRSGLQIVGNGGLASIPVFDITGIYNDDSGYHYQWFHFALRDRLLAANGGNENHVMWRGNPVPFAPAWDAFVGWVSASTSDEGPGSQRDKVIRNKPTEAVDGCWRNDSTFVAEPQTLDREGTTECNTLFPSWTFPRRVAGGPVAANILKCALQPPSRDAYAVAFSDAEWQRLQAIFPNGVCDWSQPGVSQVGVTVDGSFGPSPLNRVEAPLRAQATGVAPTPAVTVSEADWMATMARSAANNTLDTKVGETAVKGGVVRVGVIYRSRPETRALVHQELTEIYMIVEGSGTLVTGGTATDSQPVSDPPNLGLTPNFFVTQVGGEVRRVGPGDIVIIPAGLPHRLSEIDGPMSYTIYRFEPTQP